MKVYIFGLEKGEILAFLSAKIINLHKPDKPSST